MTRFRNTTILTLVLAILCIYGPWGLAPAAAKGRPDLLKEAKDKLSANE